MSLQFGSAEWIQALASALNESDAYATAAATWEGDLYFVCAADGPIADDIFMYLDLQKGRCLSNGVADSAEQFSPEFTLTAPLTTWQSVLGGTLNPIQAIMLRKIQLTGPMTKIMRNSKAAVELVNCAAALDTAWPS